MLGVIESLSELKENLWGSEDMTLDAKLGTKWEGISCMTSHRGIPDNEQLIL